MAFRLLSKVIFINLHFFVLPLLSITRPRPKTLAAWTSQSHQPNFNFFKKTELRSNEKHESSKKHPPGNQFFSHFFFKNKSKKMNKKGDAHKIIRFSKESYKLWGQ